MRTATIVAAGLLAGCGPAERKDAPSGHSHGNHDSHAGEKPAAVSGGLTVSPEKPVRAGEPVTLALRVTGPGGQAVSAFDAVHGEKVHLIVVREGLDQFAHLHPAVGPSGELTVTHTFPTAGVYRLFADYQPSGGTQTVAGGVLTVPGDAPKAPPLAATVPGEVRGEGLSASVTLVPAGHGVRVEFSVRDERGGAVTDLEPYLGELGHLVFVSADATRYVHVHPAGGDRARGLVAFEAHFPSPGVYKGWAQFKRGGKVHTLPLVTRADG